MGFVLQTKSIARPDDAINRRFSVPQRHVEQPGYLPMLQVQRANKRWRTEVQRPLLQHDPVHPAEGVARHRAVRTDEPLSP